VGELPLNLQPKLLRVLETGCIRRVGGRGEIPVQVRVVALTLRNLPVEAQSGGFRIDLYHRLAGFAIWLPPLRRRRRDILPLAQHFLAEMEAEVGPRRLSALAQARLQAHDWPGNVRELRNVIRRACFLSDDWIDIPALEIEGSASTGVTAPCLPPEEPAAEVDHLPMSGRSYRDMERHIIGWALRRHGGSRRQAAKALGISRSTFCDRVRRLGIKP
jgi:DNA-binding NtrC family response regulator